MPTHPGNASYQTSSLFPELPPALRRRGSTVMGLILEPRSSIRRFIARTREGVEDVAACFSEGCDHDARHDLHLTNGERLALTTIQRMQREHSVYVPAVQAILQEIKAAQAADDDEDRCLYRTGWPITKQLAGCFERALKARRSARGGRSR